MFIFKKIFSKFLFPLPLTFIFCLIGLYYLWFTKKQKLGKIFVSMGFIVLILLSYAVIPNALLLPLERKYEAYLPESYNVTPSIKYVVVLGAGYTAEPMLPLLGKITKEGLFRLNEGIRIQRKTLGSKLILTGGSLNKPMATATVMANIAIDLGVKSTDILTDTKSKDTKDEARHIKKMVADESFVLVTSASHMPRAIALFNKLGMKPIPAPTEYNVKLVEGINLGMFFPHSSNIHKAEKAIYEYMGFVWAMLRGQI